LEDLKSAIVSKLALAYPDFPVYDEQVSEGMAKPCFFVLEINSDQTRGVNRRHIRTALFDIHFFPRGPARKEECRAIAEWLYEHLLLVEWSGTRFRGLSMRSEIVDEVLHFFVGFNLHLMLEKTKYPDMQTMTQEVHIK